jgi:hypothetical protein
MESILPRDIIYDILDRLSNQDLFHYGLTSKTSFQSAECIWKRRYEREKDTCEIHDDLTIFWYKKYSLFIISKFLHRQLEYFCLLNSSIHDSERRRMIECILECIFQNKDIFMNRRLWILRNTLIKILDGFMISGDDAEREISHKYYKLLFPKE